MRKISPWGAAGVLLAAAGLAVPASAAPAGTPGNKPSFTPDISADGRFVAFASDATNLVSGDRNGKRDVFLRDLRSGTTRLVSKGLGGAPANGGSYYPSVSKDGRFVAFMSDASNLVAGDTNAATDAFRADLSTGKIVRVSVGAGGAQANGKSEGARMSADGNSVVFGSAASNLVDRDTNKVNDIFLRDLTTGTTRRLSTTAQGNQNLLASNNSSISPNGSIVGWLGPVGLHAVVYRWDRATAKVSVAHDSNYEDFQSVRVSDAGPSWTMSEFDGYNMHYGYTMTARPASASFQWWLPYDGWETRDFDVDATGAIVVSADYGVIVTDKAHAGNEAGLASLSAEWKQVALSGDGRFAVGVDESTGQVRRWTWGTGAVTTVSTN